MAARSQEKPQGSALANRDHDSLPVGVETTAAAMAAQAKASVAARYLVAFERPRDWRRVEERIMAACERPAFAEEALYLLEKGGSKIEGLSVRFAEETARWVGNLMAEAVVTYDDENQRIVRVIVTDLEANVTYPTDVVVEKTVERRSSKDREVLGKRANAKGEMTYRVRATDDEVMIKQNSLVSKARRNEILKLLPADLQEQSKARIRATLQKAVTGDAKARKVSIENILRAFAGLEVPVNDDMLRGYLGHPVEAITPEEFATLRGLYQAVKDGETTWDAITGGKGQNHQTQRKRESGINSEGYGGQSVKPEIMEVRKVPEGKRLSDDPYLEGKDAPEPEPEFQDDRDLDEEG